MTRVPSAGGTRRGWGLKHTRHYFTKFPHTQVVISYPQVPAPGTKSETWHTFVWPCHWTIDRNTAIEHLHTALCACVVLPLPVSPISTELWCFCTWAEGMFVCDLASPWCVGFRGHCQRTLILIRVMLQPGTLQWFQAPVLCPAG